jgi:SAM-dependent methyltransferase
MKISNLYDLIAYIRIFGLRKIRNTYVPFTHTAVHNAVRESFTKAGIEINNLTVDVADYRNWVASAGYPSQCYADESYGRHVFSQKTLEHYIACKLLNLKKDDVYIDIASSLSPLPDLLPNIYGCIAYRQDLIYPSGISGNVIGGDAAHMPVPDSFADSMALHCSFEHFENISDIEFIKEANRVLKPGGRLCIVPLYMFTEYAIQTDMRSWSFAERPSFDWGAAVYQADGYGNRFGRFYDVQHFISRVIKNLDKLKMTLFFLTNEKEVHPTVSTKFVALFEKAV